MAIPPAPAPAITATEPAPAQTAGPAESPPPAIEPEPFDPVAALADAAAPALGGAELFSGRLLAEFYAERDFRPVWDQSRAEAMLALAEASRADGFRPDDFHARLIRDALARGDLAADADTNATRRTAADLLLTDALLRYLHHFQYGKYNPARIARGAAFTDPVDAELLKAELAQVAAADDPAATVGALLPQPPFYQNLKRAYQRYLAEADLADLPRIPAGPNLVAGARDGRVPLIRERLAATEGYQTPDGVDPTLYDDTLVAAVRAFQGRSGLTADGVIGPATLRVMNNHGVSDKLATIRANLERMRWLYHDLPSDYIFVDLTAYQMQVVRDHRPVWESRIVIGKPEHPTPSFRGSMDHLVLNPDWTMPPSIQRKTRGVGGKYQVIDRRTGRRVAGGDVSNVARYRIVQPPGPNNALGKVKFMFPNDHAIYLHDTPSKHLFGHGTRAYSHGCVRVQNPLDLAGEILRPQNWDDDQISKVVGTGRTRYVKLTEHLPVLLYYLTAVADEQGNLSLRRDIYGRDRALIAILDRPAHGPRITFTEPDPAPAPEAVEPTTTAAAEEPDPRDDDETDAQAPPAQLTANTAATMTSADVSPRPTGRVATP